MSVESTAIALHHSRAKGTAKVVLLGIANHDGDGGAWPSVQTLAKYANVDVRNVQRALDALVKLGEIKRIENGGGSAAQPDYLRPNLYHFLLRCPPHCDGSRQHKDTRRGARYVPNYLSFDPLAETSPGGAGVTPPLALPSPLPVALASPETVNKKPPVEHRVVKSDAPARAVEEEQAPARPACPQRRFIPCAYGPDHTCVWCGSIDPAHINAATGEVA